MGKWLVLRLGHPRVPESKQVFPAEDWSPQSDAVNWCPAPMPQATDWYEQALGGLTNKMEIRLSENTGFKKNK